MNGSDNIEAESKAYAVYKLEDVVLQLRLIADYFKCASCPMLSDAYDRMRKPIETLERIYEKLKEVEDGTG